MLVRHRKAPAKGKRKPPPLPLPVPPAPSHQRKRKDPDKANGPAKPSSSLPVVRESRWKQASPPLRQPKEKAPWRLRDSNQSAASRTPPWTGALPLRPRGGSLPAPATNGHQAVPAVECNGRVNNHPSGLVDVEASDEDNALLDIVALQFDQVISSIDGEPFLGKEEGTCMWIPPSF